MAAATGVSLLSLSPIHREPIPILCSSTRRFAVTSTDRASTSLSSETASYRGRIEKEVVVPEKEAVRKVVENPYGNPEAAREEERKSLKDFFDEVEVLIGSEGDEGSPPRWFSPLDTGAHAADSPLLLFLPGIDGTGLGLVRHHTKLGKLFDIWCLHIPVKDRTPAEDLVKFIERTVRSESYRLPKRPIYIVGESIGAHLALDVAARNPEIDIVLILANPGTSFTNSLLQPLSTLLEAMPDQLFNLAQYMFSFKTGDPLKMMMDVAVKRSPLLQMFGKLAEDLAAIPSYLSILAGVFPKETLLWKLQMLKSSCASAYSHLHAVRAQTLVLSSGSDQLLLNQEEVEKLRHVLPKCEIRRFGENKPFLFLEDDFDLVTVIKCASFYRRGKYHDYVSDYMLPTPYEFKNVYDSYRLMIMGTSPFMLSTLEDGKVVRGLAGIPSEGPALYVGYHMLLGLELAPLVLQLLMERNIHLRGMAHPMMFAKLKDGMFPELQSFDTFRLMGAVPVSATNLYKLLSSNSHVLLYPGGVREALHRKGEEYKLFWPEHSEFVRMAAKFGAKIIPFGCVGEDDLGELVFDYNDQMKISSLKTFIEDLTNEVARLRNDETGELVNQDIHLPGVLPKLPGRFYCYFGKPIETAGREQELRDREKAHELYLQVKSEVERCIAYLKEKRESDPYRSIISRMLYRATHGFSSQVPAFDP